MSRGWAKASACRLQITLSCAFLCHIVSLQYLSRSSLHRLAGLPCRLFLSYGLQVVTREVHRSSLRRLICPAQDHFIFLTVWIISMTFVLSLTQMLVFLSLYVMLSIRLSILVCAAASLFCACLVSVQVSAPYVIAGSTQELYTGLFRLMARLLLKISRCLAYAAHHHPPSFHSDYFYLYLLSQHPSNPVFGLSLFPCGFMPIICLQACSSGRILTCSNHFNRLSVTLLDIIIRYSN